MNIEAAITRYIDLSPPSDAVQREVTLSSSFDFIVSIIGPRRAGKTTYMLEFREKLNVPKENKIFLNCEDINLLGIRSDDLQTLEETMLRVYSPVKGFDIYIFMMKSKTYRTGKGGSGLCMIREITRLSSQGLLQSFLHIKCTRH